MKTSINTHGYAVILTGAITLLSHCAAAAEGMNPALWAQIYNRMQTSNVEVAQVNSQTDIQMATLPSFTQVGSGAAPARVNHAAELASRLMAQQAF